LTQVSRKGDATYVNVLQGDVEVVHEREGAKHIYTGESIETTVATMSFKKAGAEYEFNFSEPLVMSEHGDELAISTAEGQGADGTAFKMNDIDHHYDPTMVLIKNSTNDYNRKGYLRFDLKRLEKRKTNSVSLKFTMVHSRLGSLALSQKEARFSVYGVMEDHLDQWRQGLLDWNSAPANAAGSTEVDQSKTIRLGGFELPRGKVSGEVGFSSDELKNLINQDRNRLITLIIVCDSLGDQIGSNYVYAIAGKEHPSLMPPTLWMSLD